MTTLILLYRRVIVRSLLLTHSITERRKMEDITTIISTVGFPIAMALLLFWYMREELASHKEETNGLKDAIQKLELAITTLINKLEDK